MVRYTKNLRRKSNPVKSVRNAGEDTNYRTVAIWTPVQKENLPLAERAAKIGADKHC